MDSRHILISLAVASALTGAILLVSTPFGGWYIYEDRPFPQSDREEWGEYEFPGQGAGVAAYLLALLGLLACMGMACAGFAGKFGIAKLGAVPAGITAIIAIVAAIVFFSDTSGASNSWLEAGFYGSLSGAVTAGALLLFVSSRPAGAGMRGWGMQGQMPMGQMGGQMGMGGMPAVSPQSFNQPGPMQQGAMMASPMPMSGGNMIWASTQNTRAEFFQQPPNLKWKGPKAVHLVAPGGLTVSPAGINFQGTTVGAAEIGNFRIFNPPGGMARANIVEVFIKTRPGALYVAHMGGPVWSMNNKVVQDFFAALCQITNNPGRMMELQAFQRDLSSSAWAGQLAIGILVALGALLTLIHWLLGVIVLLVAVVVIIVMVSMNNATGGGGPGHAGQQPFQGQQPMQPGMGMQPGMQPQMGMQPGMGMGLQPQIGGGQPGMGMPPGGVQQQYGGQPPMGGMNQPSPFMGQKPVGRVDESLLDDH